MKTYSVLISVMIFLLPHATPADPISEELHTAFSQQTGIETPVPVLVFFTPGVDFTEWKYFLESESFAPSRRAELVISALRDQARQSQRKVIHLLENSYPDKLLQMQSFWIVNAMALESVPEVIYRVSELPGVQRILLDREIPSVGVVIKSGVTSAKLNRAEISLKIINAHKLWQLGLTGRGRLMMNIDTGVDGTHPALAARWRGNRVAAEQAWFDPAGGTTFPEDCNGHGTHVMGTMAGCDSITHDTIGVAPDAEWIAARTLCTFPHLSNTIAAFQWAMDPDGDSTTTEDMPDVICGFSDITLIGCPDDLFGPLLEALELAGIAVVFPSGGGGPSSASIAGAGNINRTLVNSWATGSVDRMLAGFPVSGSSSRGPSTCGGTGSYLIKPEAVAPGTQIRSAVTGGGYSIYSGASMANAHVAGAIALLKQAFPAETGHNLKMALYRTAKETPADSLFHDPGEPSGVNTGEDNNYGMGLIDLWAAYQDLRQTVHIEKGRTKPGTIVLSPNFPNPFNQRTTIQFYLPVSSPVHLEIYNGIGQLVREIFHSRLPAGENRLSWDGRDGQNRDLPSGIYLFIFRVQEVKIIRKVLLIR